MRLRVDRRTGEVVLTLPPRASRRKALEWAAGHRPWIERQLAEVAQAEPLGPGAVLPLRGEPHRIDWEASRPRVPRLADGRLVAGGPAEGLEARLLRWLKRQALDLLAAETAEFAAKAGVTVSRVAVGDPVSRWGSCSSSGAIRYSWRLLLAPDFVRRATVAHEVAHRVHMHHGPAFHALVEALLGADPKPARLWLRRQGAALHRIGGR
ncbi:MAG: M48 family metallopeptidase [Alphaproteobacteria bacterium]|nr:M48 family metallopeptidase [Alphaproteobacteria bacterium]MBV9370695.1 M48 family metallopeptidase [Alphaproteobacteria bacterium]MBV9899892.1 M48 family metallopeptidase [Alphaproteobacteria bacterium]